MSGKILAIGRYNFFVSRSISELSSYCELDTIILTKGEIVNFPKKVGNIKTIANKIVIKIFVQKGCFDRN